MTAIQQEYVLPNGGARWRFRCDCGRVFVSNLKWARAGNTASCGCKQHKKHSIDVARPWSSKP